MSQMKLGFSVEPFVIPVISLWQPYASAVVKGYKEWETRHWALPCNVGWVAIHATKRFTAIERDFWLYSQPSVSTGLRDCPIPLGCVVGLVYWGHSEPTERVRQRIGITEQGFGNYADGRFAHRMIAPVELDEPINLVGRQTIFWRWKAPDVVKDLLKNHRETANVEQ